MKKMYVAIAATSLLAACSSMNFDKWDTDDAAEAAARAGKTAAAAPAASASASASAPAPVASAPVQSLLYPSADATGALAQRNVFYDFDNYSIADKYQPIVAAHSQFLNQNTNANVVLQGNCDARGSREYNLALGQRRADSVRKMMEANGVKDSQISTVSFGSEKPRQKGHTQEDFAANRRTDIVYQGQ